KNSDDGEDEDKEYNYFACRIDEVLPDDEVLSLNESTNTLQYAKIIALMDKGIQDIYEITTKSGKIIRTTASHPYLVQIYEN
ncbi:hypothetical protein COX68_03690, partial [Candidatus Falkowbacteria bacterium CG_4_10_14_0_2_um_filter_41_15]